MVKTFLITGGTGLIGHAIAGKLLERGDTVIIASRDRSKVRSEFGEKVEGITPADYPKLAERRIDVLINLTGKNLAEERWNKRVKFGLRESRLKSLHQLMSLIDGMKKKPESLVSASGVDYYGHRDEPVTEDSNPGKDFTADLCIEWERAAFEAEKFGVRTVVMRTGLVISRDAEALKKMVTPLKFFAGGYPAPGDQYLSWIHIDDIAGAYLHCADNTNIRGAVNGTAPNTETIKDFMKIIGKIIKRPVLAPVPRFVLRLLFGESSQLIVNGRNAVPEKLLASGFRFKFSRAEEALREALVEKGEKS